MTTKPNAMRHTISGSDAAEDDDLPQCERCGALVSDPCLTDKEAQSCELPDSCFPNGRLVDGKNEMCSQLRAFADPTFPSLKSEQQKLMAAAADEIKRLTRRVRVLEKVISEELYNEDCQDDLNQMVVDEIHGRTLG